MNRLENLASYRAEVAAKNAARTVNLRRMVNDGLTLDEAATSIGITRGGLADWCRRNGLRTELTTLLNRAERWVDRQIADRIEDLEWMVATGENLTNAADRLGITRGGLEKWCKDNNAHQILDVLRARDPYSRAS